MGEVGSVLALSLGIAGIAGICLAAERPEAVSPGSATGALAESRCPAFSWSAVSGAEGYELVVYRVRESAGKPATAVRELLPGSATLWTPALDSCLARGGRYAWSVRARMGGSVSEWSLPKLFDVFLPATETGPLELVDDALRTRLWTNGGEAGAAAADFAPRLPVEATLAQSLQGAAPSLGAVGDPALQVDGAAVVTTATLGAGLCEALTYRYVDQGDGTVRDCHTGKVWMKDADCIGQWPWSDAVPHLTIFGRIALLNAGSDFGCAGYTPGTYTDWEVPSLADFCSGGNALGSGVCPPGSAVDSLVNSAVSGPIKVTNARGNGSWAEGDAFAGVQSENYWTASCFESCFVDAYSVSFASGFFSPGVQTPLYWVWPVRSGP